MKLSFSCMVVKPSYWKVHNSFSPYLFLFSTFPFSSLSLFSFPSSLFYPTFCCFTPFPPYCIRPSLLLPLSDPLPQGIIPPLVVQCVGYINRDSVLREPGLFRIPGDVATIRRIRSDFVRGVSCVCESAIESHLLQHIWPRGREDD